jgi:Na+/citrate or Na+/malate symporter
MAWSQPAAGDKVSFQRPFDSPASRAPISPFSTAVALTPRHKLVEAFHPANLVIIIATVLTLIATGFHVGKWLKMYTIETVIVNACHNGLGDVMILTSRAHGIDTIRTGFDPDRGAVTVTLAIIAMAHFKIL